MVSRFWAWKKRRHLLMYFRQMNRIERGWQFYASRPWLGGLFFWTGFDYRGEPNPLEFPATGSEFGILDYCGFPKDEAWYLKAWWTEEPVLHILPHWNLSGHEGEKVSIWVYGNCDEVELSVNGRRLGRQKMPYGGHLEWSASYRPGKVVATGYVAGEYSSAVFALVSDENLHGYTELSVFSTLRLQDMWAQPNLEEYDRLYVKLCTMTPESFRFWDAFERKVMGNAMKLRATDSVDDSTLRGAQGYWIGYGVDAVREIKVIAPSSGAE